MVGSSTVESTVRRPDTLARQMSGPRWQIHSTAQHLSQNPLLTQIPHWSLNVLNRFALVSTSLFLCWISICCQTAWSIAVIIVAQAYQDTRIEWVTPAF